MKTYCTDEDWTPREDGEAAERGWGIFFTGGDLGHPVYEIERIDDAGIFDVDDEAWAEVIAGFIGGDPLCVRAVRYLIINAPDALVEMLTTLFPKEEDDE